MFSKKPQHEGNSDVSATLTTLSNKMNAKDFQDRDIALYFNPNANYADIAAYNEKIINKTIKKTEENRKKKQDAYRNAIGERVDAAWSYLRKLESGGGQHTSAERYFGRQYYMKLLGENILRKAVGATKKAIIQDIDDSY